MPRRTAVAVFLAFATILVAFAAPGEDVRAASSGPEQPALLTSIETNTARALATTSVPGRDLIDLTRRLRLHGNTSIRFVVNPATPEYPVGTRHQFYLADVTRKAYFTTTATLRVVTEHAYWYVKDGMSVGLRALRANAEHFERKIYPTTRGVFGSEVQPGVDNDPRITVLIAPLPGVGGYFSTADAYPRIINPYSNERDMIYLASVPTGDPADPGNYFAATLAHEFQHMIHWNENRDRDVWLDEGFAEVAMFLNGYSVGGADSAFTRSPDTQLNAWDEPGRSAVHYGASYLFTRYLMDKFGGAPFLTRAMQTGGEGTTGLDAAIREAGFEGGFDGAFKDWTVANALNDRALAGGRYSYSQGGRARPGRTLRSYPATRGDTVRQYAADYIALQGNIGQATLMFAGDAAARVIAAEPHNGQYFWYSNRRDSGDATLTRSFDLRSMSKATLNFWLWHDIESMFDYAYVVASTDAGITWTPLKGRYTTTENPNGTSFGHGWTGSSGGGGAPRWVEESVDLTPYAGKRVMVRFEYVTDEGFNRPGLAVDDLRIPEVGYADGAESDNGWVAAGFVRIGSNMPQQWHVVVVEKGSPNRVTEMVVGADGRGTLSIPGFGPGKAVREAVVLVAPLAPKTTEPARYTVTVTAR
jgi:immune inhibitor A